MSLLYSVIKQFLPLSLFFNHYMFRLSPTLRLLCVFGVWFRFQIQFLKSNARDKPGHSPSNTRSNRVPRYPFIFIHSPANHSCLLTYFLSTFFPDNSVPIQAMSMTPNPSSISIITDRSETPLMRVCENLRVS